ncbi:MFS transporter [Rhodococcus sp. ABRD24]|uniref:MFS transporter n=1 Tax=Rhodococcus sp. ABRD24 TaxID=2507582 RepID=UPI00103CABDB|nr:MFS transporter [Rhodococcus sp. ABRD24]QBJ96560.1 MFS transporter [Rhodococcus sp. ABRD24]
MTLTSSAPPTPRESSAKGAWWIVLLLCAINIVNFLDKSAFGLVALPVMEEFGLTPSQFGTINSAFFAVFAVSAAGLSWLGNRYSARWLLVVLIVVWSLLQLPIAVTNTVVLLVLCRIALGAAEAPFMPISQHVLQQWFPDRLRQAPIMVVVASGGIGGIVLIPLLAKLIESAGWRWLFVVLAVAGFVVALLWAFFGAERPTDQATTAATDSPEVSTPDRVPYRKIVCSGTFLGSVAALFVAQWILAFGSAWVPAYLEQGLGFTSSKAGLLVGVLYVIISVGTLGYGVLSQMLSSRGVSNRQARVVPMAVLFVAGAAILILSTMGVPPVASALLLGVGCALAQGGFGIGPVSLGQVVPPTQRPAVLGMLLTGGALGAITAPTVFGALIQNAATPLQGYHHALWVTAGVFALAAVVVMVFIRPERDAATWAVKARVEQQ